MKKKPEPPTLLFVVAQVSSDQSTNKRVTNRPINKQNTTACQTI